MPIKTLGVAFDLDGTLFNSCSVSEEALKDGFKGFWDEVGEDGPVPSWDEASRHIGQPSYGFFPALLPESHRDKWRLLHYHIGRCEKERLENGCGLTFDGVHDTLDRLVQRKYFLGCLSNASKGYFDSVLDGCKLRNYFDRLEHIGEKPGVYKSDILKIWAEELGGQGNLIYVGDRGADIDAAHDAGLKAVGVTFGYGTRDELRAAEALIDTMPQLLDVLGRIFPTPGN